MAGIATPQHSAIHASHRSKVAERERDGQRRLCWGVGTRERGEMWKVSEVGVAVTEGTFRLNSKSWLLLPSFWN